MQEIINRLLNSTEPSIRWKVRLGLLNEDVNSPDMWTLQQQIKHSSTVQQLLSGINNPQLNTGRGVYAKWQGIHWVLASLADMGYPQGDELLIPAKNALLDFWLNNNFYQEFEANSQAKAYQKTGVPVMQGRHRRCASQQGNTLYMLLKLGLHDDRLGRLVERLLH